MNQLFILLQIALNSEGVEEQPLDQKAPELPNFIKILSSHFHDSPLLQFLHHWESVVFSLIIAILICVFFYLGTRKRALIPTGFQNGLELIIENLQNAVVTVLGPQGKKYTPFLGTLFIYILTMNLFGLVPLMKSPSSNLNITAGLAICVFSLVQYLNIKNMGFFGFLYHLAGSPKDFLGWAVAPFLFILELITQISRPITLSLRLFGSVLGEDILMGAFALFGAALISISYLPVDLPLPLQIPFMFFAILMSFMQALVFTLLSTVYILLSTPSSHEHH